MKLLRLVLIVLGMNVFEVRAGHESWTLRHEVPTIVGLFIVFAAADWRPRGTR